MWALKAFVLGSLAFALVGYAAAAALAVAAQAGGSTIDVGVGPLLLVSVTLEGATRVTTFGPGILVLALGRRPRKRRCRPADPAPHQTPGRSRRLTNPWSGRSFSCC